MTDNAVYIFKALGDETRCRIMQALSEREMYTEILAERLKLTPATVSFHMKKLLAAGLVDARKEQYYTIYSLRAETLKLSLRELIAPSAQANDSSERLREEMYRRKVIKAFMPSGFCKTLPAQIKKRMIIYEEIIRQFSPGKSYPEKEVNRIISSIHEDFCTVRREFIGLGWMRRENGIYTVTYSPDEKAAP